MIDVQNLHKAFKTKTGLVQAVRGVSFTAHDGEITGAALQFEADGEVEGQQRIDIRADDFDDAL